MGIIFYFIAVVAVCVCVLNRAKFWVVILVWRRRQDRNFVYLCDWRRRGQRSTMNYYWAIQRKIHPDIFFFYIRVICQLRLNWNSKSQVLFLNAVFYIERVFSRQSTVVDCCCLNNGGLFHLEIICFIWWYLSDWSSWQSGLKLFWRLFMTRPVVMISCFLVRPFDHFVSKWRNNEVLDSNIYTSQIQNENIRVVKKACSVVQRRTHL